MFTKKEIQRQSVHILLGVALVILIYTELISWHHLLIGAGMVFILSFFLSRGRKVPFQSIIAHLQRKDEKEGMHLKGLFFYLMGSTFAVLLFEKEVALGAILILAFGDSISRLAGPYGFLKHPFNNQKFIDGIIAGIIAATIAAWAFVPIGAAFLASAGAMIIEGLDIRINQFKIDDNLTIPLVSGFILHLLLYTL